MNSSIHAAFVTAVLFTLTEVSAIDRVPVTFAGDIAPIIHQKCTGCHREGQPGPFPLLTFEDVRDRAETIQAVVHDRYMPPWKPVSDDVQYSNDRRLTDRERDLIDQWVDGGLPSGDLKSVQTPTFASDWSLGKPDLVLKMTGRFAVPATGRDIYRSFVFPAALPDDKWVKAIELRPTAKGAVHHALFFIDTSGEARQQDGKDGKPGLPGMSFLRQSNQGGSASATQGLGGYVPGAMPNKLPGDLAMLLPKGSDIIMQTHFHPSGKPEWEQAELAVYFTEQAPSRLLVPIQLPPLFGRLAGIDIPPGKTDFEISHSFTLPVDVDAIAVSGHAHYICREMEMKATLPNGKTIELLTIDDWDLDWQDQYQFDKPLTLPAGTRLDARLLYDNSAENPANPHSPPKRIQWGRESTDEMGSLTLQVIAKDISDQTQLQQVPRTIVADAAMNRFGQASANLGSKIREQATDGRLVQALDRNRDGKLQKSEVPERVRERVFDFADKNDDGVIDANELDDARKALERIGR